jgi:toxin secretion/phage lysis holin
MARPLTYEGNRKDMIKFTVMATMGGSVAAFLFGTWTPLLKWLLVMVALDILSGIAKGFYDKGLRSRKMSQGMLMKAMTFLVIILANGLDQIAFDGVPVCKTAAISFYIGMEGLSFIENLAQMNVPLPGFVKKYLLVLKENNDQQPGTAANESAAATENNKNE